MSNNISTDFHQLKSGDTLRCSAGTVRVLRYLGEGGQGEVYEVELNGKHYAAKYYFAENCTALIRNNLVQLIDDPVESESFAWPLYLIENGSQFGYIMNLRPSEYHDIAEWIGGRFDTTLEVLVKACMFLCDAFHDLHAKGYSYKDISNSNVSFNPKTGDVCIVDNDNVTPNLGSSGVLGTNGFMAPELISGMARTPSRLTDLHSLSVLLFQMLVGEHPLNGKKEYNMSFEKMEETDILSELYGPDTACFIFKDEKNLDKHIVPTEPAHANAKTLWLMYPDFIKRLFVRAFVDGIKNPHERPLSNEWTDAFIKLYGMIYSCPKCGMSHLYDREQFFNSQGMPACSKCKTPIHAPRIKVGENVVLITDKSVLYTSSLAISAPHRFTPALEAEVKNGRIRFKNLSDYRVECHGMYAQKGAYTDYITSADSISVNGKTYRIAL